MQAGILVAGQGPVIGVYDGFEQAHEIRRGKAAAEVK